MSKGTDNIWDQPSLPLTSSRKDTGCCSGHLRTGRGLRESSEAGGPGLARWHPLPGAQREPRKGRSVSELVCLPPSSVLRGPGRAPGSVYTAKKHRWEPETRRRCRLGCQSPGSSEGLCQRTGECRGTRPPVLGAGPAARTLVGAAVAWLPSRHSAGSWVGH